ncbi:hypothetical protein FRB99_000955 [Tulasnella sp. 403]|nr:hypothetical protein FRB99_000955 [Tulasnella sp. 403]
MDLSPECWVSDKLALLVEHTLPPSYTRDDEQAIYLWDVFSTELPVMVYRMHERVPFPHVGGTPDGRWIYYIYDRAATIISPSEGSEIRVEEVYGFAMDYIVLDGIPRCFAAWGACQLSNPEEPSRLRIAALDASEGEVRIVHMKETIIPEIRSESKISDWIKCVLISSKLGIVYVLTYESRVHLVDVGSGTLLYSTVLPEVEHGFVDDERAHMLPDGITGFLPPIFRDRDGYRLRVNEDFLIPYIRRNFKYDENLAMAISGRTGLGGAEDLWMKHYPN